MHDAAEGALTQRHYKAPQSVDTHEDIHIVAVILNKALIVFDCQIDLIFDLLIGIVYL